MTYRVYKFVNLEARERVVLTDFTEWIQECFAEKAPNVKVKVYEDCYVVFGEISNSTLRSVGRAINKNQLLGRWAVTNLYDGEYPLTGILRCPECGAGMVISRTTNTLKDGTKKRITYYACENWKNKGTAVCHGNMIRTEKANAGVFRELEKIFSNEKFLKTVLKRVNEGNTKRIQSAKKNIQKYEKELQACESKRKKIFEAYEADLLSNEEFLERKNIITTEQEELQKKRDEALNLLTQERQQEIPYEVIKDILQNFGEVLTNKDIERGLKKQLLHMLISEITIDKRREIESINLKLTDELLQFLQDTEGTLQKGVPSNFLLSKFGIPVLDLKLAI